VVNDSNGRTTARMRGFIFIAACLFTGCDAINVQQFRIVGAANDGNTARLKRVLRSVADQTGLVDRTPESRVPQTLVLYLGPPVRHFLVEMGARTIAKDVIVDLSARVGPRWDEYRQARKLLASGLSEQFGSRLSIAPEGSSPVPINPE